MYSLFGVSSEPFDDHHTLVTSNVIKNPFLLASLRLVIAFFTLATLLASIIWDAVKTDYGDAFFSYFTHLTYIGICAYEFAAGVQTLSYARNGRSSYALQSWPRILRAGHVQLLSSVLTFPILVTLVYWVLLASPETFADQHEAWSAISMHALNTVFGLSELLLTNVPFLPWLTLIPNILLLGSYVGIAYITRSTQGFYVYPFLDPKSTGAKLAIYIVGIPVGECILFCLVQGAILVRQRLTGQQGRRLTVAAGDVVAASARSMSEESWQEVKVSKEHV